MIGIIISIYLLGMLLMSFVKLRVGIAMYLFYQMLVPFVNINIGPLHFGANLTNTIVFISLFFSFRDKIKYFEYKSLMPFVFLYFAQLFLIPFQSQITISDQINFFRLDIMSNLMLPFAMINVMNFDKNAYLLFRNILITAIFIAVIYGIYLTQMPGINPWLMLILPFNDAIFNDSYALAESSGRLFGRISSVFSDSQAFGLVLTLSFIFIYSLIDNKVRNLRVSMRFLNLYYILLLNLIIISIFVCGIRTPIIALIISALFYLLKHRKITLFFYASISMLIIFIIIQQIPDLTLYIESIFDTNSANVKGSSLDMRLDQLNGSLDIIKGNEFTGLGYGWTASYISTKGDHPVLLAFESLLYVVLCNSGFIGILIWILMIIMYFKYVIGNFNKEGINILLTLLIAYLSFALLTGDYGYMKYFLIFYVLIFEGQKKEKFNLRKSNFSKKRKMKFRELHIDL
jgi:hypothetical protein